MDNTSYQKALGSVILINYYVGDQMKKKMGRACGMYGIHERYI